MGLSIEQKYNICLMAEKHPKWTQLELAKWAYQVYQLPSTPSQGTISRLLSKKSIFMNSKEYEKNANRLRKPNNLLVRKILQEWVSQSVWNGIPITSPIIQDAAQSFWRKIPSNKREGNGSFSHKWIAHFLNNMDLSIDNNVQDLPKSPKVWKFDERPHLKQILSKIPMKDLFTLDETFLVYNLPLDYSIYEMSKVQRKLEAITIMICCNLDGSEKLNPLVVGRYENYQIFKHFFPNQDSDDLGLRIADKFGIHYHSNRKSWLTSNLFHDWLCSWDKRLISNDRHIWIVLDDSCSHRVVNLKLKNIHLIYTSANSKFLPFNWGILDEFKIRYRMQQYNALIDLQTQVNGQVLKYEQSCLTMSNAFRFIRSSWDSIQKDSIKANWKSSGIISSELMKSDDNITMLFKNNEILGAKLNELCQKFKCGKKWDHEMLLDLNLEHKNPNFLSSEEIIESSIVDQWEPELNETQTAVADLYDENFNIESFDRSSFGSSDNSNLENCAHDNDIISVSNLIDKPNKFFDGPIIHDLHTDQIISDVFGSLPGNSVVTAVPHTQSDDHQNDLQPILHNDQQHTLLNVPNDFSISHDESYLAEVINPNLGSLNNERLVMLTTLQTNIDIAKSMVNILKHAEVREVGLSENTLNEMKSSYNNCLKKIKKTKEFLSKFESKNKHRVLEQHVLNKLKTNNSLPFINIEAPCEPIPRMTQNTDNSIFFNTFSSSMVNLDNENSDL